nr:hypothetical protein [Tanacetum cinerariifolium]
MTKPYLSHRFIANCFNIGNIKMEVKVTPTKPGRMTKPYLSHCFIANCFNTGNIKMGVKETLRWSDEVLKLKNFKKDESKGYQDKQLRKVRIVLKFAKINKIQTISTQDQKPQRKA